MSNTRAHTQPGVPAACKPDVVLCTNKCVCVNKAGSGVGGPDLRGSSGSDQTQTRFEDLLGVGPVPEDRVSVRHQLGARVLSARAHPHEDQDQDLHVRHVGSGFGSDSEVRTLLCPFSLRFCSSKVQTGVHVLFRNLNLGPVLQNYNSEPRTGPRDGTWWDQNPLQRPASKIKKIKNI